LKELNEEPSKRRRSRASATQTAEERDEPVRIPLEFADAMRDLLNVEPDSEPIEESNCD
jgi:hypothetical protein